MSTTVIPAIAIHEIYSGSTFTGVPSNGTHSEETIEKGRIQKWIAGTLGGEFAAPANVGMKVEHVFWNLTCAVAPNTYIYLVDDDDTEYLIDSQTSVSSGDYAQTNYGIFVPPNWKLRFEASQAISAVTNIVAEDTGVTGDGVTAEYDLSLVHGRVDPSSVSIVAGTVTFTDPGSDGILVGAGAGGGSGVIDYLTGIVTITLNTPSDFNASNALATYDYNNIGRVGIVIGDGWNQPLFSQIGIIGGVNLPPTMQRS
jgi:hypothetical protein